MILSFCSFEIISLYSGAINSGETFSIQLFGSYRNNSDTGKRVVRLSASAILSGIVNAVSEYPVFFPCSVPENRTLATCPVPLYVKEDTLLLISVILTGDKYLKLYSGLVIPPAESVYLTTTQKYLSHLSLLNSVRFVAR